MIYVVSGVVAFTAVGFILGVVFINYIFEESFRR